MRKQWSGKRYYSLNYFLREKFGEKVFKISLDAGFSCPNRDGTISSGGCVFCSARGSGDFAGDRNYSISRQFEDIKSMMSKKWKGGKYIAYFQAYTNTYGSIDALRRVYEEALAQEGVVALAIATRPDCLGEDVVKLLEEMNRRVYTWIELGLQTVKESTAKLINRGYSNNTFEEAVTSLRSHGIDVVVHSIFGLPGETHEDMMETIDYIAHKDVQGIKIHLLHLMKDTPMVKLYEMGRMQFLEEEEYVNLVCRAITKLPESMVIHRITGDAPRELLIGPLWSLKKWEILNAIDSKLLQMDYYQALYFSTN
jgi:uncharacterized protein